MKSRHPGAPTPRKIMNSLFMYSTAASSSDVGVACTRGGRGGSRLTSFKVDVDASDRRSGILNNSDLKCRSFEADCGDAGGYALCLETAWSSEVCGPGVPGERRRLDRRPFFPYYANVPRI